MATPTNSAEVSLPIISISFLILTHYPGLSLMAERLKRLTVAKTAAFLVQLSRLELLIDAWV